MKTRRVVVCPFCAVDWEPKHWCPKRHDVHGHNPGLVTPTVIVEPVDDAPKPNCCSDPNCFGACKPPTEPTLAKLQRANVEQMMHGLGGGPYCRYCGVKEPPVGGHNCRR